MSRWSVRQYSQKLVHHKIKTNVISTGKAPPLEGARPGAPLLFMRFDGEIWVTRPVSRTPRRTRVWNPTFQKTKRGARLYAIIPFSNSHVAAGGQSHPWRYARFPRLHLALW